jgi:hypothetical protein
MKLLFCLVLRGISGCRVKAHDMAIVNAKGQNRVASLTLPGDKWEIKGQHTY